MIKGFFNFEDELEPGFDFLEYLDVKDCCMAALNYLHGDCQLFALAISKKFGHEIILWTEYDNDINSVALVHAFNVFENEGNKYYLDIRGITDDLDYVATGFDNYIDHNNLIQYSYDQTIKELEKLNINYDDVDITDILDQYGHNYKFNTEYYSIDNFNKGLARLITHDGKWGVINKDGAMIVATDYDRISDFREDTAVLELNEKSGFIDRQGNKLTPLKYDYAFNFEKDFANIGIGNHIGFLNKKFEEYLFENKIENIGHRDRYLYFQRYMNSYIIKSDDFLGLLEDFEKVVEKGYPHYQYVKHSTEYKNAIKQIKNLD